MSGQNERNQLFSLLTENLRSVKKVNLTKPCRRLVRTDKRIFLRQLVANWEVEANKITADVNEDSELDLADVILLRQYVAGWEVTLGAAE